MWRIRCSNFKWVNLHGPLHVRVKKDADNWVFQGPLDHGTLDVILNSLVVAR